MASFTIISPGGEVQDKIFKIEQCRSKPLLLDIVRRLLDRGDSLDPWLEFPQNSCSFAFGTTPKPLPVGALRQLWKTYPGNSECPVCQKPTLHLLTYSGLFSIGGGAGICPVCGYCAEISMGGFARGQIIWNEDLDGTPFKITGGRFGGCVSSKGVALLKALGFSRPDGSVPSIEEIWGTAKSPVSFSVPLESGDRAEIAVDLGAAEVRFTPRPGKSVKN